MFLSKTVLWLFAITTAISTSHLCTFYFSPDFTFEIRVNEKWDDQLENKDSEKYKKISTLLKEQVLLNTDVQHLLFSSRQSSSLKNPFLIPFHVTPSLSSHCLAFTRASIVTYLIKYSLLSTWSHGRHVSVPKQSNGDHELVLLEFNCFRMQTQ